MTFKWLVAAAVAATVFAAPAFAQNNDEMIVVTAMKRQAMSDDEAVDVDRIAGPRAALPYVSIIVPADFIIFTVTLETGTRSQDEAAKELERTFNALATRVSRSKDVTLEIGEPGSSSELETATPREVVEYNGDRSSIPLVFKFAVQKDDTFRTVRARAEKFIAEMQMNGRVEAVTGDLQYIGVTDPKKHREDLLKKIAEDARLLQTTFSGASTGATAISLTGLEGRVRTRPNGPLDMEIYIPYSIVLGSPQR